MATTVFAIEIELADHAAPVVSDITIGLFNRTDNLASNASSGQKNVTVDDGSVFKIGDLVTISDTAPASEINSIDSIAGDVLTMVNNLANTYTTAATAKVDANSVFRWLQNTIVGLTGWAGGIIIENGIGNWSRSIELEGGGNIAEPGFASVAVKNGNKFYDTLDTKGIVLNGKTFRVKTFSDTTETQRWTGFCQKPNWDSFSYRIPAQGGHNKRRANLISLITDTNAPSTTKSSAIPATFGEIEKAIMLRTKRNTKTLFNTADDMGLTAGGDPQNLKLFQVISGSGTSYELRLFKNGNDNSPNLAAIDTALTNKYIQVTEGANGTGVFRKIINVSAYTNANHSITIDIQSHFEVDLSITGDTWVKILEIDRVYQNDTFPLKSFLDSNLNEITAPLELFSFDDTNKEFTQIPNNSLSVVVGSNNNKIDAEAEFFETNPDTLNSFIIKPVTDLQLTPDLDNSNSGANGEWPTLAVGLTKIQDGFYTNLASGTITNIVTGTLANINDRDGTSLFTATYKTKAVNSGESPSMQLAIDFKLPAYPINHIADTIFFLILMDWDRVINSGVGTRATSINIKRIFGDETNIHTKVNWGSGKFLLENVPDFYFTTNIPATSNKSFFKDQGTTLLRTGYKVVAPFGLSGDKDKYENFQRNRAIINLSRTFTLQIADHDETININAMAVLFQKNLDIKDEIFSGVSGRIFNDTWGGRKTAADLIESPIDILEHICRLQNWTESSSMPTDGWGKNYPSKPLIKTSGDGSFDATDPEFTVVKNFRSSRQLINQQAGFTDRLKRSLCKNYFLANWIDANGNEAVKRIIKSNQTGLDTVVLNDITNRGSIRIVEPDPAKIYPEPFVLFDFDQGLKDFTKAIRVTNVDFVNPTAQQKQDFIEGVGGPSAEDIWDRANALWLKTLRLNKPRSDMTEALWSNGADGQNQGFDFIVNWLDWMSNVKIELQLHYDKVKDWEETHRFELTLIHQTNSIAIECLTTRIEFAPNPPFAATVQAIMFKTPLPVAYALVDQLNAIGGDSDLVDKLDAIGGDSDKVDKL